MNDDFSQLVAAEEAKRSRQISPHRQWEMFEQFLAWAECQPTWQHNTKDACLRKQERVLAGLEAWRASQKS
jgi:hypothetical protein